MKSMDAPTLQMLNDMSTTLKQLTRSPQQLSPDIHQVVVELSERFDQELNKIKFSKR